jgi:hypothetical protein
MTSFPCFIPVLLLFACACGPTIDAAPETISGTVVDEVGVPVPSARVRVGDTLTSTDAAGHFTVTGAPGSYDVTIAGDSFPFPHVYLGMSTQMPLFRLIGTMSPAETSRATVMVTLPAADTAALQSIVIMNLLPDNLTSESTLRDNPSAPWQAIWRGAPTVTARLYAFQAQMDADSKLVHYLGFDTIDLSLSDGTAASWSVSWKPPAFTDKTISVTASGPAGTAIWGGDVSMRLGSRGWGGPLTSDLETSPELSVVVPDLPGVDFVLTTSASDGKGATSAVVIPGLTAGATVPLVHIDPAPSLVAPAQGGPLAPGTPLRWTGNGQGASFLVVGSSMAPSVYIFGGPDEDVPFPDLAAVGVELPHGATYQLSLFRQEGGTTVDELAAQGLAFVPGDQPFLAGDAVPVEATVP